MRLKRDVCPQRHDEHAVPTTVKVMAGQAKVALDEESLHMYEPDELQGALSTLHVIDAREAAEFERGSIAGAQRLGKSDFLFSPDAAWVGELVHDLVLSSRPICVFSEHGIKGQNTSRDLFVIWCLHESGVAFERLGRLVGGVNAWQKAGFPLEKREPDAVNDLAELLQSANVSETQAETLSAAGLTLQRLLELHSSSGRASVLAHLADAGVARLAERQAVANSVGRASRAAQS